MNRLIPYISALAALAATLASCSITQQDGPVDGAPRSEQTADASEAEPGAWMPPSPKPDDFDWIQHKNGEWLKGDIELIQHGKLHFDSDKMGEVKFDLEDVAVIRSPRLNSLLFEDDIKAFGTLLISDGHVMVGGAMEQMYAVDKLVTIVPGEPKESDYWSGYVNLSYTARSGNTDSTDFVGRAGVERRTLENIAELDYEGVYSEVDGDETENNHLLDGQFSIFVDRRLYLIPIAIEGYRDTFQNIDQRWTPSVGAGYFIFDLADLEWTADLKYGVQYTTYESVEANEERREKTRIAIASTDFEVELTNDVDLEMNYSISTELEAGGSTDQHARLGIAVELTKVLDLTFAVSWDRVGRPQRDNDGVRPENNDYRMSAGLEIDF
jgi:putative salt-induced outer membrane protein YdiY